MPYVRADDIAAVVYINTDSAGTSTWALVLSFPCASRGCHPTLTPAERAATVAPLRGDSNQNIAMNGEREPALPQTRLPVCCAKLGVRSSAELLFKRAHVALTSELRVGFKTAAETGTTVLLKPRKLRERMRLNRRRSLQRQAETFRSSIFINVARADKPENPDVPRSVAVAK